MTLTTPVTAPATTATAELDVSYRARSAVRLMVAETEGGRITHSSFGRLGDALRPGDVLVINVSATVPAAIDGRGPTGPVRLHLSSPVAGDVWTVEPRRALGVGSRPWRDFAGGLVKLPAGVEATFLARDARSPRLWLVELAGVEDVPGYLGRHGRPIRYAHEKRARGLSAYQTVYASEPGSAEMPSAGRPFTSRLIASLAAACVVFAPVVLHCGVASFEAGELPDVERYQVEESSARLINQAHEARRRVIAVGTTSARAVETVTDSAGVVHPGQGSTDLVITPERGVRAIDGIVTGWHEAGASHLELIAAVAGRELVARCYEEATKHGYLWHEFGDSLLVLSGART